MLCFSVTPNVTAQSATSSEKPQTAEVPVPSVGALATVELSKNAQSVNRAVAADINAAGPDLQPMPLSLKSKGVDKRFEGFGFDDNDTENDTFIIPPDPIGAAGKSRVIAVVNSMIEARNKGGKLKWRDGLADFFAPLAPARRPFDPKIVYDQYEDRFVVVALELGFGASSVDPSNVSRILLAVSKGHNPKSPTAADWYYHAIDAKQTIFGSFDGWADYPGFETDEEAIYVTANIFTFVPFGFYGGARLWIVDKGVGSGGFYEGGPAGDNVYDPYATAGLATTTMPAKVFGDGGVGGSESTLGTFLVSYSGLTFGGPGAPEAVQVVTIDDPLGNSGGPFFLQEFVVIGDIEDVGGIFGWPFLPDAPQLNGPFPIEVNDRRALDAVWREGSLWITTTINPNYGADSGETTAHWFQLDTTDIPNPIALRDQGDIGGEDIAPGTYTFFPSVAVNRSGHTKFGFSASAASIYAGAFVTGRQMTDPPGTVGPSEVVHEGEGPYKRFFGGERNRWGDYSGISVDPTNDKFFWVFNEFADTPGSPTDGAFGFEDGRWGTAWARCKVRGR
jgi:hypothetical protein